MKTILFLAHTESDGSLPRAAYESIAAAKELAEASGDSSLIVGLLGADVAAAFAGLGGVAPRRCLAVSGEDFAQPRYATDTAAVEALCRVAEPDLVLAPGTSRMARIVPGVAQRLGGRVDTHVGAIRMEGGAVHVSRSFYRQRIEGTVTRAARPWMLLLEPGTHAPLAATEGRFEIENVPVEIGEGERRTTVEGLRAPQSEKQTIRPEAELLFVAGAGWTKKQADGAPHTAEAEQLILGFLDKIEASLGGSKSLVDLSGDGEAVLSFMGHMHQVGQTGSTPRHRRGLSTCCHGEEPHVVGWRFIQDRRAINLDANCGWARGKADVVYVADAFEVMSKVNALLAEGK